MKDRAAAAEHQIPLSPNLAPDRELIAASGLFDEAAYLRHWPVAATAGQDPIEHYLTTGWRRDVDPGPDFSTHYYLATNNDVRDAGVNPLVHYLRNGKAEGRRALPPPQRQQNSAGAAPYPVAPSAVDWDELANRHEQAREPLVDVLVPVYGGFAETMRCLFSVLSAPQATPYRLVVVDDCSPSPEMSAALVSLAERALFDLHRTPQNVGFVGACNFGMALHPERDVILLNSDTEVFGDWLDRLRAAALRHPRTATVTPFSNNAEICSYPNFIQDNWSKLEIDDATLDRMAARANAEGEVDLPTGVGFCMYVRRACLDQIGIFEERTFGKGYGEENDLCLRAAAAGWRNILAPNVFVRHYGATSFGASKAARVAGAVRTVERMHPGYLKSVGEFISSDPVRPYREALDITRLTSRAGSRAVLFVTHRWGGGTERHVRDLAKLLERDGVPVFFCRTDPADPARVMIEDPVAVEMSNLPSFSVARELRAFVKMLRTIGVAHVHIHHLAGYPENAAEFFRLGCAEAALTYDISIHDYTAVCPRVNLIDHSMLYCGEPTVEYCETCVKTGSPTAFGRPSVWEWRDRYARLLAGARRVFVPDTDVERRMRRFFPATAFVVRPHPEDPPNPPRAFGATEHPRPHHVRRIALLGMIGIHKGSQLLEDVAKEAVRRALPLEFVVVGYTDRDKQLLALGNVTITGPYEEGQATEKLAEARADLAWFPAVCPETYSYTLSAAFEAGVFPVAFDLGAIGRRIRASAWGELMPIRMMLDPDAVTTRLHTLTISRPSLTNQYQAASYPDMLRSYYEFDKSLYGRVHPGLGKHDL